MEYAVIAITVLFGAGMTFFSGFGLGTIMLPVFSLFFDLPVAIGAAAVVHFSNNIFKFAMVYKFVHVNTFLRFGIPAILAAVAGGYTLTFFDTIDPVYHYRIGGYTFNITPVKLAIGALMIFFAWFDLNPQMKKWEVKEKHLPIGGILSGYFGGFSGHQGAFRATFLTKAGLSKEEFIGTSNAVSLLVDLARMIVYIFGAKAIAGKKLVDTLGDSKYLLMVGIVFAFLGTYIGRKLIHKTTITGIQRMVGLLLFIIGVLLMGGIV